MAGTALRGRLTWLVGEVVEVVEENSSVRSIVFECPGWPGHVAGQHIDIRLTAEDGYQAQRSYSIAAPTDGEKITITVELVGDGEVSPFLVEVLRVGDRIELRGPIGGYFVWTGVRTNPLLLIGGGSGVVPLMAMLRAREALSSHVPAHYLASARSRERLIYFEELQNLSADDPTVRVVHTLTRSHPPGWDGPTRRVDKDMLDVPGFRQIDAPDVYVCGPTGFVEAVASALVDLGHGPAAIRTERFGPSGG